MLMNKQRQKNLLYHRRRVPIEDIQVLFGQEVASLVASHTEEDKNLPWSRRKKIALEHLAKANRREKSS